MGRVLVAVLVLAGCSPQTSAADAATPTKPAAGASCPASMVGYGACSADAGDLLVCTDAGWRAHDDCRGSRTGCTEGPTSVQCGCAMDDTGCLRDAGFFDPIDAGPRCGPVGRTSDGGYSGSLADGGVYICGPGLVCACAPYAPDPVCKPLSRPFYEYCCTPAGEQCFTDCCYNRKCGADGRCPP